MKMIIFLLPATDFQFGIVASHTCTATKNWLVHFIFFLSRTRTLGLNKIVRIGCLVCRRAAYYLISVFYITPDPLDSNVIIKLLGLDV